MTKCLSPSPSLHDMVYDCSLRTILCIFSTIIIVVPAIKKTKNHLYIELWPEFSGILFYDSPVLFLLKLWIVVIHVLYPDVYTYSGYLLGQRFEKYDSIASDWGEDI